MYYYLIETTDCLVNYFINPTTINSYSVITPDMVELSNYRKLSSINVRRRNTDSVFGGHTIDVACTFFINKNIDNATAIFKFLKYIHSNKNVYKGCAITLGHGSSGFKVLLSNMEKSMCVSFSTKPDDFVISKFCYTSMYNVMRYIKTTKKPTNIYSITISKV